MMREYHVRFRERFGVKLPLPTRPLEHTTADNLHIARQLPIEDKWPKC